MMMMMKPELAKALKSGVEAPAIQALMLFLKEQGSLASLPEELVAEQWHDMLELSAILSAKRQADALERIANFIDAAFAFAALETKLPVLKLEGPKNG